MNPFRIILGLLPFSLFAVLAGLLPVAWAAVLTTFGRGLATLRLAAYMLITLRFVPFTAAYAKATTPAEYWGSPTFVSVNRRVSSAWGGAILAMAVGHLIADALCSASRRPFHVDPLTRT